MITMYDVADRIDPTLLDLITTKHIHYFQYTLKKCYHTSAITTQNWHICHCVYFFAIIFSAILFKKRCILPKFARKTACSLPKNCKRKGVFFPKIATERVSFSKKLQEQGYSFGDRIDTSAYKNSASAPRELIECLTWHRDKIVTNSMTWINIDWLIEVFRLRACPCNNKHL